MNISVHDSAVKRLEYLRKLQGKDSLMLRITVDGGGCSGFQYKMELRENVSICDIVFQNTVVTDEISLEFLKDSTVRFESGLIGAEFKIDNPNAVSGCGCGTSFAI